MRDDNFDEQNEDLDPHRTATYLEDGVPHCYMGHPHCYDMHSSERAADDADMESALDAMCASYADDHDEVSDGERDRRDFYRNRDYN